MFADTKNAWRGLWCGTIAIVLFWLPGCALGPRALERTHGPYAGAIQQVDEEQFLRNIVRLRYLESATALEVASIAAQYELNVGAEARPFFSTEAAGNLPVFGQFATILPFAAVSGANRPTVSMAPQDDGTAIRQMLTPISMETMTFLVQSGWPVSNILRLWAERLNGVPNLTTQVPPRGLTPDFLRFRHVSDLLQRVHDQEMMSLHAVEEPVEMSGPLPANAITASATVEAAKGGFEYQPRAEGKSWALVKREKRLILDVNATGKGSPELAELAMVLNLKPNLDRYDLVMATGVSDPLKNPTEPVPAFRITPRSTSQAYFYLANGVEVPPAHLQCGLVHLPDGVDTLEVTRDLFRVHVCKGHKRPAGAYVAIHYRDHWFYIDDRDQDTKATLLLMLQLRRLDFKRQQIGVAPALTLPIGR